MKLFRTTELNESTLILLVKFRILGFTGIDEMFLLSQRKFEFGQSTVARAQSIIDCACTKIRTQHASLSNCQKIIDFS